MRFLPRLATVALLAACSGKSEPAAGLTIMMFTGDLDLPEDTDLVGLYIAQLEGGRTRRVLAYEATPLREPGKPARVPFPADFVVGSRGEADRVHVRLVAYKKQTHEVLTMREARTQVPTDDRRGLRLNLFFTNQNNVQDATPGSPVLAASNGLSTLDQDGEISSQAFERFTSICNGAPAPEGMTAGDDGSCVALDVPLESLPAVDAPEFLAGTRADDSCYDVDAAFADGTGPGSHVLRVARSSLSPSGECRVPLPALFDPARLNVAMVTNERVFERADGTYSGLRPLAASLAFRQVGSEVVLPAHVCDLARKPEVDALAFSQRAAAWGGLEPVCSKWSAAKAAGSSDGSPPTPLPDSGLVDAGPDAPPPPREPVEYSLAASGDLVSFTALHGDVGVIVAGAMGSTFETKLVPRLAFESGAEPSGVPYAALTSGSYDSTLHAVSPEGAVPDSPATVFVQTPGIGLARLDPTTFAQTPVTGPSSSFAANPAIGQVAGHGRVVYYVDDGSALEVASIDAASQLPQSNPPRFDVSSSWSVPPEIGALGPAQFYVADTTAETQSFLECLAPSAGLLECTQQRILPNSGMLSYRAAARVGTKFYGMYDDNGAISLFDYAVRAFVATPDLEAPLSSLISVGERGCGVYWSRENPNDKQIRCFTEAELRTASVGTVVVDQVAQAAVAADETGLYVAYQCRSAGQAIHVARLFDGNVKPLVNRCLGDGGSP